MSLACITLSERSWLQKLISFMIPFRQSSRGDKLVSSDRSENIDSLCGWEEGNKWQHSTREHFRVMELSRHICLCKNHWGINLWLMYFQLTYLCPSQYVCYASIKGKTTIKLYRVEELYQKAVMEGYQYINIHYA